MRNRKGAALLMSLSLLMLGAALLAGSAAASRAAARSVKSFEATLVADGEARVALASVPAAWNASLDSLPIGATVESVPIAGVVRTNGVVSVVRTRIQRVNAATYVVLADSRAGPDGVTLARRRLRLVLVRPVGSDTSSARPAPRPIARWSMSELF